MDVCTSTWDSPHAYDHTIVVGAFAGTYRLSDRLLPGSGTVHLFGYSGRLTSSKHRSYTIRQFNSTMDYLLGESFLTLVVTHDLAFKCILGVSHLYPVLSAQPLT